MDASSPSISSAVRLERAASTGVTDRTVLNARGGLAPWQQRVILSHLEEHLSEPVTLAALALIVRLSPFHFCRAFKQTFGMPPHRFQMVRRVERAKDLLANGVASITEIGFMVGYRETSAFCVAFRRATGTTPGAYRRRMWNGEL